MWPETLVLVFLPEPIPGPETSYSSKDVLVQLPAEYNIVAGDLLPAAFFRAVCWCCFCPSLWMSVASPLVRVTHAHSRPLNMVVSAASSITGHLHDLAPLRLPPQINDRRCDGKNFLRSPPLLRRPPPQPTTKQNRRIRSRVLDRDGNVLRVWAGRVCGMLR